MPQKVKCPYCGYEMPLTYSESAVCKDVFYTLQGAKLQKSI